MVSKDTWAAVGSALAFLAGLITMAMNQVRIKLFMTKMTAFFSSTIQITIPEYTANRFERNELFVVVEAYISVHLTDRARKIKAELRKDELGPHFFLDNAQEIIEIFEGTTIRWFAYTDRPRSVIVIQHQHRDDERRFYRVAFHHSFREKFKDSYLPDVLKKGRAVIAMKRPRRLFTNNRNPYRERPCWSNVVFQHPATFDKLAMDPEKKKEIMDDLRAFRNGKQNYENLGKAWKRGYLLFGPPGTGKSTMIAAIANYLEYDIYDLELTAVIDNTELRKLFIQTTEKSIIVIEDIDCSVDIISKRRDKSGRASQSDNMTRLPIDRDKDTDDGTKLTLSGMLNFIDGLWSACGGERIIIFTTNNKDKLDPALIRPGRMDKHIEMSYCDYDTFKVLANNYLFDKGKVTTITDVHVYDLYPKVGHLLKQVNMSPAEVAGYLMRTEQRNADACLRNLLEALEKAKFNAATRVNGKAKEETEQKPSTQKSGAAAEAK